MENKQLISSDEVISHLNENPEFRKAKRKLNPFFELVVKIINRRNELGLSQKELAERAGTHQSRISKIESAELDVRLSTLIDIAEALETELNIQLTPISEQEFIPVQGLYSQLFQSVVKIGKHDETKTVTSFLSHD